MKSWSLHQIREALEAVPPFHPYPTREERTSWEALNRTDALQGIVQRAEQYMEEPLLPALATDYLSFIRTGSRDHWSRAFNQRTDRLTTFVLAECVEGKGRFFDAILDSGWALCECSTWCAPPHAPGHTLPEPGYSQLDLTAAHVALEFAQAVYLVGDAMERHEPRWTARMLYELDTRIWTPYMERDNHWWLQPAEGREVLNNWTAVCNNGIVGSALFCMEDLDRLAKMIHRAIGSMGFYLDSFAEDGGSSEGVGYWNYGFGNYVQFRRLLYQRTGGVVDLFADPRIHAIAEFPLKFVLSGDRCVNFSDATDTFRPSPWLCAYLYTHLGIQSFGLLARKGFEEIRRSKRIGGTLNELDLLFNRPEDLPTGEPVRDAHVYLPSLQWMIARHDPSDEDTLILAAKGGHNGENHNQNDGGAFIIHWRGESLVADLGSGTYTRDYFGPERYEYLVCSSRGHSVPLPNHVEQGTGRAFAAHVLAYISTQEQDTLKLDLKGLYPEEAGVQTLIRTLSLVREGQHGFVELTDHVRFSSEDRCDLLLPIYSFHPVELIESGVARIRGNRGALRVEYDPEVLEATPEIVPTEDEKLLKLSKVEGIPQLMFRPKHPALEATVVLRFVPERFEN